MTPFPHFIDVASGVDEARRVLETHGIRHLPVKDGGELVGLVTDRDLEVAQLAGGGRTVGLLELCVKDLYVVELHTRADQVVESMSRNKVGCAIVVRDGKLAGIVTASDVCRLCGDLLRKLAPPQDEPA